MTHDPTLAVWRKSTRTNTMAACVEVASLPGGIAVRDSKNPTGPALTVTAAQWSAFTASVQAGLFD
jgi:hypothetical protein